MRMLWRSLLCCVVALAAPGIRAQGLTYEPVALGWSAEEVDRATGGGVRSLVEAAQREDKLGCLRHCERLDRIFARLVEVARTQSARAKALPWSLTVVRLSDVEALALPGGQVLIGEPFIDLHAASDETLAFVLAHEMAHSILEHERQALTFARMLLPRQVPRSVQDMYAEMDFNHALLKAMEPVMQQGELEADELGLLLASVAGFDPQAQLLFIEQQALEDPGPPPLVATHPSAQRRADQLRDRLPLAQRLYRPPGTTLEH